VPDDGISLNKLTIPSEGRIRYTFWYPSDEMYLFEGICKIPHQVVQAFETAADKATGSIKVQIEP
jgi:hypothetical protein